ncbi:MAG: hypothetical protein WCG66_12445, partial [bacterium]
KPPAPPAEAPKIPVPPSAAKPAVTVPVAPAALSGAIKPPAPPAEAPKIPVPPSAVKPAVTVPPAPSAPSVAIKPPSVDIATAKVPVPASAPKSLASVALNEPSVSKGVPTSPEVLVKNQTAKISLPPAPKSVPQATVNLKKLMPAAQAPTSDKTSPSPTNQAPSSEKNATQPEFLIGLAAAAVALISLGIQLWTLLG